jgi:hypothetical protein
MVDGRKVSKWWYSRWAMRFCILRRSARSEILVQSSLGFAEAEKALEVPEYLCVGAAGAAAYW